MSSNKSLYRHNLPHLNQHLMVCDGGLETCMIYHEGLELPAFAYFTLLHQPEGLAALKRYYQGFAEIAKRNSAGLILETPTWRASRDWGQHLGYSSLELEACNLSAIALLVELREQWAQTIDPIVIGGVIGPRGDGYRPDQRMSVSEAANYHGEQIATFAATAADLVSAYTINYLEEAIGITLAAKIRSMPLAMSFTLETDGRLPTGQIAQAFADWRLLRHRSPPRSRHVRRPAKKRLNQGWQSPAQHPRMRPRLNLGLRPGS